MSRAAENVHLRPARDTDVHAIAQLNNFFAAQHLMLWRSPEMIASALDDYLVAVGDRSQILACGALKEYSPSVAEIAAIAVSPDAQGLGLGRKIVTAVEELARKRGIPEVFALTLEPAFFEALGYSRVDRARYPEKIRRDCIGCARRFACNETCFAKPLRDLSDEQWQAAA
jgi:N-acetylglutamate synthase-like GNAT family acetyltransferase